jgi:hypothetical protein
MKISFHFNEEMNSFIEFGGFYARSVSLTVCIYCLLKNKEDDMGDEKKIKSFHYRNKAVGLF